MLVAETEILISPHYIVRTALKGLFWGLPIYHVLLGFILFAALVRYVGTERLGPLPASRFSWGPLVAHLGLFAVLSTQVERMAHVSLSWQSPTALLFWLCTGLLFLGSWLAVLLPPSQWTGIIRSHGLWLAGCLVASVATNYLAMASDDLWRPMAAATFYCTGKLLNTWFPAVILDPDNLELGTETFQVHILPGCSGYEGMGLIAVFCLVYFWLRRRELVLSQAAWLLPAAMAIVWLANNLRLALLVAIGTLISPEIAIRGFHSQAGWISFSLVAVVLVLTVERRQWFRRERTSGPAETQRYPAASFLLPFLATLFTRMISQAFSVGFDIYYPIRTLVVAWVLFLCMRSWARLLGSVSWRNAALWGGGVYLVWIALVHGSNDPTGNPWTALDAPWSSLWIGARVFGAVLIVPLVEELAFRGYLLRRLQAPDFERVPVGALTPFALVASSVAFGALHSQFVAGTLAGLAYGWLTRRGRLADAVVAHSVTNLCLAVQVILLGQWSLW